jgi:hypothetical protein
MLGEKELEPYTLLQETLRSARRTISSKMESVAIRCDFDKEPDERQRHTADKKGSDLPEPFLSYLAVFGYRRCRHQHVH